MGRVALLRFPNSLFQCAPFIQELPIRFAPSGSNGETMVRGKSLGIKALDAWRYGLFRLFLELVFVLANFCFGLLLFWLVVLLTH